MCNQCEAVMINGRLCHEIGCPIAWKDYTYECNWCGCEFKPEEDWQIKGDRAFCSEDCYQAYYPS